MRFAIVQGGVVVNTAVADIAQGPGWIASDLAGVGWLYQGGVFSPPPAEPTIPSSVTRRQGRRALILMGKNHLVQPAIDAIEDPMLRALVQADVDDAQTFDRADPTLQMLAAALELDLDALFALAAEQ